MDLPPEMYTSFCCLWGHTSLPSLYLRVLVYVYACVFVCVCVCLCVCLSVSVLCPHLKRAWIRVVNMSVSAPPSPVCRDYISACTSSTNTLTQHLICLHLLFPCKGRTKKKKTCTFHCMLREILTWLLFFSARRTITTLFSSRGLVGLWLPLYGPHAILSL